MENTMHIDTLDFHRWMNGGNLYAHTHTPCILCYSDTISDFLNDRRLRKSGSRRPTSAPVLPLVLTTWQMRPGTTWRLPNHPSKQPFVGVHVSPQVALYHIIPTSWEWKMILYIYIYYYIYIYIYITIWFTWIINQRSPSPLNMLVMFR